MTRKDQYDVETFLQILGQDGKEVLPGSLPETKGDHGAVAALVTHTKAGLVPLVPGAD